MIVHLIDGTYELFRHFYGLRSFSKTDPPFGAVAGVLNMIAKMIEDGATHVSVATDHVIESFRNELWSGYKTGAGIERALFGQAVLNGVVMVSYFNQLQEEGHTPYDAVLQGAGTRLRTVLMTALLAMLGLLPMALSHGIGSETQRPLAIVIIGGLVSATLLTDTRASRV